MLPASVSGFFVIDCGTRVILNTLLVLRCSVKSSERHWLAICFGKSPSCHA